MRSSLFLWIIAFCITVGSAVYQRVTGPTYPVSGHAVFGGQEIPFRFDRSHVTGTDAPVAVLLRDTSLQGVLEWRHAGSAQAWNAVPMNHAGDSLVGILPQQAPAGKLEYRVVLSTGTVEGILPSAEPVVIRFKGDVPLPVLVLHIVLIFGAMLLSTRCGLEVLARAPSFKLLAWSTVVLFAVGGILLGAVVQKYAFGAYWTGWPFGSDLTDNKTALALILWLIAALAMGRVKRERPVVLGAAIITIVVFMIPHSLLGSELPPSNAGTRHTPTAQQP